MLDHGWFWVRLRQARGDGRDWCADHQAIVCCPGKIKWGVLFYLRTLMAQARQETVSSFDVEERYRQLNRQQLAAEQLHRATFCSRFVRRDDADGG